MVNKNDYQQFWSSAFDSMEEFVFIIDNDFTVRKVNKAFIDFTKKTEAELTGKKCYELVHGTNCPVEGCPYQKLVNSKKFERAEIYDPKLELWLDIRTTPIFFSDNQLAGSIHMASDISSQIQLRESTQAAKDYTDRLYQLMPSAVFAVDCNKKITRFNRMAEIITGYKASEVIGKECTVFAKHPCPEYCELLDNNITKPIYEHEAQITTKDGKTRIISKNADVFKDKEGKIVGGIESFEDITEIKKAKDELEAKTWGLAKTNEAIKVLYKELEKKTERLQEIDRLKSDFVSSVSHELRTPLTPMREAVTQISEKLLGPVTEKQTKFLDIALRNIDRMTRIINDLLDMSKIESGKVELNKEETDLISVAESVILTFTASAQTKGLEIKGKFSSKKALSYADKDKLTQVFTNLVNNSLKFTDKGEITISIKDNDDYLECAVTDTGRGIAAKDIPKVFSKFQQFGKPVSTGGTGLGLAISKSLVELHHGTMHIESVEGKGTSFIFTLPKYNQDSALLDIINNGLIEAKEENKKLFLAAIKVDGLSFGGETGQKNKALVKSMLDIIKQKQAYKKVGAIRGNELIFLTEPLKGGFLELSKKLNRTLKEIRCDFEIKTCIDLAFGYAVFPEEGRSARELIDKAISNYVSQSQDKLKRKILVVDDEKPLLAAMQRILEAEGFVNISQASCGVDALSAVKENQPDLILLDVKMPDMSGYEVVGRLKEDINTKDIPIIIMSGYQVEFDKIDEYVKEKAIITISKPFTNEQIVKLINYLV